MNESVQEYEYDDRLTVFSIFFFFFFHRSLILHFFLPLFPSPVDIYARRFFKKRNVHTRLVTVGRFGEGGKRGAFFFFLFFFYSTVPLLDFAGEVYRDICAKSGLGGVELRRSRVQSLDEQYAVFRAGGIHRRESRQHCHTARTHIHVLRGLQLHGHE